MHVQSWGDMKKILILLTALFLLNGCAESLALLGPASSSVISGGNAGHSIVSSATSYGIKKQTGMSPTQHALTYVKKNNPEREKNTCISFIKKTNSEMCAMLKKKINSTRVKIINNKNDKSLKDNSLLLQTKIDKKSKIKYLD